MCHHPHDTFTGRHFASSESPAPPRVGFFFVVAAPAGVDVDVGGTLSSSSRVVADADADAASAPSPAPARWRFTFSFASLASRSAFSRASFFARYASLLATAAARTNRASGTPVCAFSSMTSWSSLSVSSAAGSLRVDGPHER